MFKSVIFDLDGTLGDSLPICIEAFKEGLAPFKHRRLEDAEIAKHFGISEEGMIKRLIDNNYEEAFASFLASYERLLAEKCSPFSGVVEMLDRLYKQNIPLFVITGKGSESTQITLKQYGIAEYFIDVFTGSPDGDEKDVSFEELLSKHNINREETLYVGDAPTDIEACKRCKVAIAAAAWASTAEPEKLSALKPEFLYTDFKEFTDFLFAEFNI